MKRATLYIARRLIRAPLYLYPIDPPQPEPHGLIIGIASMVPFGVRSDSPSEIFQAESFSRVCRVSWIRQVCQPSWPAESPRRVFQPSLLVAGRVSQPSLLAEASGQVRTPIFKELTIFLYGGYGNLHCNQNVKIQLGIHADERTTNNRGTIKPGTKTQTSLTFLLMRDPFRHQDCED